MTTAMATKQFVLVLALGVSVAFGCAGRKAVWSEESQQKPTQQTTDTGNGGGAMDLVAQGDAKWEQRTTPDNVRAAIAAWEKAAEADPGNPDLLIKLTRAYYFLADAYLRDDEKQYLQMMDQGVKWGEKAMVATSPEFEQKMRGGAKYPDAVKSVPKEGVPAMYWYASALGKWAKRKGFAVLLGQKDNVKATMDRCLELDPEFFYGGPHRYFGAYYAIAPSFAGGDLEKSKVHFKKSLEIQPDYVGTKVLWAAELAVKLQDEETFDRLLAEVLAAPDDIIAELEPEIVVEKQKAKELIANKSELF
jgi:tetratricopeptide (TPR) repeat protein